MENSKISKEEHEAINRAMLNGDAHQLEQFVIACKEDSSVSRWMKY